ncbi:MAG TPA: RodZ domain-containing protein, partial [Casimicrobiaceae bacterium]
TGTPAEPAQPEGRVLSNPAAPGDATDAPAPRVSAASLPDAALASAATPQSTAPTPALQSDTGAPKPQVGALQLPPAARTLSDTTSGNAGAAPAAPTAALQVIFRGTSWIDVKDAQGASVLTMTGNEGATRTIDASPPLDVVVGNADHVDVIFRGQHLDLAAHAKQNVARLQLR